MSALFCRGLFWRGAKKGRQKQQKTTQESRENTGKCYIVGK